MEELPNEHIEHAEHAEHAVHEGNSFLMIVSGTIAVLAVIAAVIASLETIETSAVIGAKNDAVLKQSQASDQWAFFQAKSLKQDMFAIAGTAPGDKQTDFMAQARRYDEESNEVRKKAEELEHDRDVALRDGEEHEHRHYGLTLAATFVHVGIAVTTIAIITKGHRWPWYAGMALAFAGVAKAAFTMLA